MDGFAVRAAETPGDGCRSSTASRPALRRPGRSPLAQRQELRQEERCRRARMQWCRSSAWTITATTSTSCVKRLGSARPPTRRRRPGGRRRRSSGNATWRRADRSTGRWCRNRRLLVTAAGCDPRDRDRDAAEPRGEPRGRSDLRVESKDDRGRAGEAPEPRSTYCLSQRTTPNAHRGRNRSRARARRAGHVGRRLDGPTTISCDGSRQSSACDRRSSGESRSSPGSRSPSAFGATRSCFGLPGNPVSSLVGALSSCVPRFSQRSGCRGQAELPPCSRHVGASA